MSFSVFAQLQYALVGVDGLTCSACSFTTEKSIRQLAFVDSVKMELDQRVATVYFKKGAVVSLKAIAQKVVDAGFSVRSVDAIFLFNNETITNDHCMQVEGNVYHFIKVDQEKKLNGKESVRVIGEKFMPKKEFKTWKFLCSNKCTSSAPTATEYFVTFR